MSVLQTDPPGPTPGAMRPRRSKKVYRRRRIVALIIGLIVVAGLVAAVVLVPPVLTRAAAVARYDAAEKQLGELRGKLDAAYADAGDGTGRPPSADQLDAILADGSGLVTDDAASALQTAREDAAAALGGGDSDILARPALDTATASVAELDAESAVLEAGLDGLRDTVDAAPDKVAAAAQALGTAWDDFRTAVVAEGTRQLGAYSDAEKSTEDALYQALTAFQDAPADQAEAALTAAGAASASMIADAEAYRAQIVAAASGSSQPTGGDVDAQLGYLLDHWQNYNTAAWNDYNAYGGDCVNFTSQGLLARGWKMDGTWSSPGASGFASKAWISTTAMEAYLKSQGFVSNDNDHLDRVRVGDVGIFDWGEKGPGVDHTMTVSKVEYTPDGPVVYFVSHNSDGDYRELQYTLFTQHQNSKVRIYSIP
ncbi:amidase domain-containing protein [Protaetiibacter intestinalis]|uniref:Putative amidase domain-containing protein n=1 Tax=Protaetiibacter intestinalis TaxID=2419774 RepID=A0A387BHH8_9MICO|nr:amidase domain-containing protein [Protaetiibacter intestinalis]AYF97990.1 hypothetical protein D7I47_06775 [Protaetiibacter intestinalis]